MPRQSSPRLPSFDYCGGHAYHVVLSTRDRFRAFEQETVVTSCLKSLRRSAEVYGFSLITYCFMPDHLHLLIVGDGAASLVRFVQHFKQATAYSYARLWQRSFYDHVLRKEESVEDVALYILNNPVAGGLVANMSEYPFSGPRDILASLGGRNVYGQS